ncbi:MAG: hypothetical protein ABIH99_01335, partial [Candidatus Micrarchaeota archaeon]
MAEKNALRVHGTNVVVRSVLSGSGLKLTPEQALNIFHSRKPLISTRIASQCFRVLSSEDFRRVLKPSFSGTVVAYKRSGAVGGRYLESFDPTTNITRVLNGIPERAIVNGKEINPQNEPGLVFSINPIKSDKNGNIMLDEYGNPIWLYSYATDGAKTVFTPFNSED